MSYLTHGLLCLLCLSQQSRQQQYSVHNPLHPPWSLSQVLGHLHSSLTACLFFGIMIIWLCPAEVWNKCRLGLVVFFGTASSSSVKLTFLEGVITFQPLLCPLEPSPQYSSLILFILFLKKNVFEMWNYRGQGTKRRERERDILWVSIFWFAPQMVAVARARPGWSQSPELSGFPI